MIKLMIMNENENDDDDEISDKGYDDDCSGDADYKVSNDEYTMLMMIMMMIVMMIMMMMVFCFEF
jgi:hypothetical protein